MRDFVEVHVRCTMDVANSGLRASVENHWPCAWHLGARPEACGSSNPDNLYQSNTNQDTSEVPMKTAAVSGGEASAQRDGLPHRGQGVHFKLVRSRGILRQDRHEDLSRVGFPFQRCRVW